MVPGTDQDAFPTRIVANRIRSPSLLLVALPGIDFKESNGQERRQDEDIDRATGSDCEASAALETEPAYLSLL